MTDHRRNVGNRTRDEVAYARYVARRSVSDDDPGVQRGLRTTRSRAKPLHWTRWLLTGTIVGATVAGLIAYVAGDDSEVFGLVLVTGMAGAAVGSLVVTALASLGVFRRTDELGDR